MTETKHLRIYGIVQGVGYRASMMRQAQALRLTGWVRNRSDETVEAMVQGPAEAVAAMIAWAQQGPRAARVERVEVTDGEGVYSQFEALPTL